MTLNRLCLLVEHSDLRAIILTQASSGLSVSDVVNLRVKDFEEGLKED